jgi:hypothetical protein
MKWTMRFGQKALDGRPDSTESKAPAMPWIADGFVGPPKNGILQRLKRCAEVLRAPGFARAPFEEAIPHQDPTIAFDSETEVIGCMPRCVMNPHRTAPNGQLIAIDKPTVRHNWPIAVPPVGEYRHIQRPRMASRAPI